MMSVVIPPTPAGGPNQTGASLLEAPGTGPKGDWVVILGPLEGDPFPLEKCVYIFTFYKAIIKFI